MGIAAIAPAWIGANLVLTGVPDLTRLPPATRLFFAGGVTLMVEAENAPCRVAGASIGAHLPGSAGMDLLFPKLGRHKRGLVASVEKPGTIVAGEVVKVRLPKPA